MERNPILSLSTADPLSRVRKRAVAEENIKQYFLLLEKTLREKDLLTKHLEYTIWMRQACH